jgi:hypothetical protein
MTPDHQQTSPRIALTHIALALVIVATAVIAVSLFPIRHSESPPFASPAFQRTWVTEAAASTRALDLWGNEPLAWRVEPYAGAPNNRRVVQYFERGRMELETGSSDISNGSLVSEMVHGEIDLGRNLSLERQPPDIPVDSGEHEENVPTYLTLSRFASGPAEDQTGQRVISWINRGGLVDRSSTPEIVLFERYIEETGHNLPDVFVDLFERPEFQDGAWIESFGYPISEPFWAEYRRNDELKPSLIQVFERRVLVYTPELERSRAFTVANSGKHYSRWRYGIEPNPSELPSPIDAVDPGLVLGDDLEAWMYSEGLGTPVDLTLSPTGHLLILTFEGQILKAESPDPDGHPEEFTVWADGLVEPQGMVSDGDSILVTAANRVLWFHERDGQGVLEQTEELHDDALTGGALSNGVIEGKPVVNSAGEVFARTDLNGDGEVLRGVASNDLLVRLDELLVEPGPAVFANGDLILTGKNDDGRTSVVLIPAVGRAVQPGSPTTIGTFPGDATIQALAIANEEIWDISKVGDVIVAVQEDDGARLFALTRARGVDQTEMVELAAGLSRPAAVEIGLDGSLYIADAEQQRVIRIRYEP